jgi:hypothetical protein
MAGWQAYTDAVKTNYPTTQGCTLIGHNGAIWASTGDAKSVAQATEAVALGQLLRDQTAFDNGPSKGIHVGGEKYMFLGGEIQKVARGKKGPNAVCIALTSQAVVVTVSTGTPQDAEQATMYLANDLISKNF